MSGDRWHRWLLDVRHGGDAAHRERLLSEFLYPWRDEVLGRAEVEPGATVLDVGTGDGLIGFGALDRVGTGGHVIFSDISQDLLEHCREAAAAEGVLGRCSFVRAGADSLVGVADASVDVVTTRSVLIYVKDKAAAFREFYRVLRPGGRVSLFEPVNRLHVVPGRFDGYDIGPVAALAAKVQAFYDGIQPPDSDPMLDSMIVTWCGTPRLPGSRRFTWICGWTWRPRLSRAHGSGSCAGRVIHWSRRSARSWPRFWTRARRRSSPLI